MDFKKILFLLFVIVIPCLFLPFYTYAQDLDKDDTVILKDSISKINITNKSYIYEDKTRDLNIDDIVSEDYIDKFSALEKSTINLHDTLSNFWIKVNLVDKTPENIHTLILISVYQKQFSITNVSLYVPDNGIYKEYKQINPENYSTRGFKNNNPLFFLPQSKKGELTTYYIKMHGIRGFGIIAGLEDDITDSHIDYQIINGIIFGTLFSLSIIFNLVLFIFFRERAYLYFLIHMVFYIIMRLYNFGYLNLYLSIQVDVVHYSVLVIMSISMLSFILFIKNFLNNDMYFTKTTLLCYVAIGLFTLPYLLIIIAYTVNDNHFFMFINSLYRNLIVPASGIVLLLIFLLNYIKGNRFAGYLLLYLIFLILIQFFELFYNLGLEIFEIFYKFGYDMGFVILALILVVGFFDRAYSTKKEKEENQKKLLKKKEETNLILEKKVKERTQQLELANNELEQSNEELTSINEELMGMNNKLEDVNVSLELANTEMEVFSSTLSHDLGNSISRINSALRLLRQSAGKDKLDERENLYLNSITESANQMNSIIKGILKLFSLTNKPVKLEEINLSLLSERIINRYILNEGDRKIMTAIQPDMIINGDYDMIQNAMDNLISNAIKYTRKNEITHIEIGSKEIYMKTAYYVKDNGIGFDVEDTNKLFTKFSRLHKNDEYEGTGLGLVSVKRIIMKHKGDIWAECTPENGTVFYFTLG